MERGRRNIQEKNLHDLHSDIHIEKESLKQYEDAIAGRVRLAIGNFAGKYLQEPCEFVVATIDAGKLSFEELVYVSDSNQLESRYRVRSNNTLVEWENAKSQRWIEYAHVIANLVSAEASMQHARSNLRIIK